MTKKSNQNDLELKFKFGKLTREEFGTLWSELYDCIGKKKDPDRKKYLLDNFACRLGLCRDEIVLACWMSFNADADTDTYEVSKSFGMTFDMNAITSGLKEKRLLVEVSSDCFDLAPDAMDSLLERFNGFAGTFEAREYGSEKEIFDIMAKMVDDEHLDKMNSGERRVLMKAVCRKNTGYRFCREILKLDGEVCDDAAFTSLLFLAARFVKEGIEPFFGISDREDARSAGIDVLVGLGLATVIVSNEKDGDDEFMRGVIISASVCRRLFHGHPELFNYTGAMAQVEFLKSREIKAKELYFSEEDRKSLKIVEDILSPERYSEVVSRLAAAGRNGCVSCLLYGAPGTGKTELVKQIALRTGRDIFIADPAKLNQSHIGVSEKMYRSLFRSVRYLNALSDSAPILLFNEADGLLGKRLNVSSSCDRFENTIQTLLLQEFEDFEGVLFATTNLAGQLDSAFERRFLFKVELHKPPVDERVMIIKSMMPDLDDVTAGLMAERYELSGGQLDNIARKRAFYEVVYNRKADSEQTLEFCERERLEAEGSGRAAKIRGFLEY